jgi:hypothetical protein
MARTMSLLVGNFDFEHQLSPSGPRTLPASIRKLNGEMAFCLAAIAQGGDCVWVPELPEPGFARHLMEIGLPELQFVREEAAVPAGTTLLPWGGSSAVKAWGMRSGWRCECPDPAAVVTANSREFSSSLESEWNCGLPGARAIRSVEEFEGAVADFRGAAGWVAKANFGMSARERCLGRGSPPSEQAVRWVRKQLARNQAVYFEPWVDRIAEFGFQFTIPPAGEPRLEGITPLLTDAVGTYRGSRLNPASCPGTEGEMAEPLAIAARAAQSVQQLGYFGPLGIDAMRYRTSAGEPRWRPVQDINARLTMGRLALGWRRCVSAEAHAAWLFEPWMGKNQIDQHLERLQRSLPTGVRLLRTSPATVGGQPATRIALLVVAPSGDALLAAESQIRAASGSS